MISAFSMASLLTLALPGARMASPVSPGEDSDWLRRRGEALGAVRKLIRDRNTTAASSDHYDVRTDDPRVDARAVASLLESFRTHFDASWAGLIQLKEYAGPSPIFLFYSRHKLNQLTADARREAGTTRVGHYSGGYDFVALHTDTVAAAELPDLMVHEAAHQIIWMRIYGPAALPAPWLMEGLAEYYGNMRRDRDGTWRESRIGGKSAALLHDGPSAGDLRGRSLAAYQRMLRKGETMSLDLLIRIRDPIDFYGEETLPRYMASWALVHYLMQGDSGRHRSSFAKYLEAEARGEGGADVLYELLGMDAAALDQALAAHARGM